ncbi:uncharacterized protein FOMMEDRAFT_169573 [Fomitiporia mediterranea MF3/22]|uniref:uncharacterized protein n=1 Tax=Fomitiporia mediterranea (strain MF3/22) TaxID=694068 RepID=UPI0004407F25|nr:uncharacterized protein FOMMEDRAFT_169573 [Fomitiporia mediterranea MF3/22]EJD01456.1 hypothetical protein FOMMEDRAFT_169573 [Fomitiporia mediterranea MF3/22]
MNVSDSHSGDPLFAPRPQPIPFKIEENAGLIIWGLINATLGIYTSFTLLDCFSRHRVFILRRCTVLAAAALSLTLGCWACQLSCSRVHLVSLGDQQAVIRFEPGFIALSFFVPIVLIFGAITILDAQLPRNQTHKAFIWSYSVCGLLVGLSVGFMHYAPFFLLPSLTARVAPGQALLVIFINMSCSLFSFLAFKFFTDKHLQSKKYRVIARAVIPIVFGSSVIGAGVLALSGMKFELKNSHAIDLNNSGGKIHRDVLTLVIPAVISAGLICVTTLLIFSNSPENGSTRFSAPQLSIASIAIASDGRVLVNENGVLPTQRVNLQGLPEGILDELDIRSPTFHWLLAISLDWSITSPFLQRITAISTSFDKRPCIWDALFRCFPLTTLLSFFNANANRQPGDAVSAVAQFKMRLLEAAAQLATQLDLPLEKLGTLHYQALETGTHIDIREFLMLAEDADSRARDAERVLNTSTSDDRGLMLFLVRTLAQAPQGTAIPSAHYNEGAHEQDTAEVLGTEHDWRRRYGSRGFKMRFMGRFRDVLAETAGASPADVDRVLYGCKDTASRGTRSVLEAGCTYVSLFAERVSCDGSSEVLVYEFAKHQLPSYKLCLPAFTTEMRNWIYSMSGFTVEDIIQICDDDVRQGRLHFPYSSRHSKGYTTEQEEEIRQTALLHFKKALSNALVQFMRNMSFVCESLETTTYLTSKILDVPSVASTPDGPPAPAHMIVFHAQHPDPSDIELFEDDSDFTHVSLSSAAHNSHTPMPSAFEYTPRALFDVAHALAISPSSRAAFREEATQELERLFDAGATARAQRIDIQMNTRKAVPGRLSRALVSSFSIDTVSDEGRGRQSRAAQRVRKGWAAVKTRARSLRLPSRSRSRKHSQAQSSPQSNSIPLEHNHSASRTRLISRSHSASVSTVTTSTGKSSASFTRPVEPVEPVPTMHSHARSTVDVNNSLYLNRCSALAGGYPDAANSIGRSWGRSAGRMTGSGRDTSLLPPPPSFRPPGRHTSARVASKSVPDFATTNDSGFF